jgi:hypothetical protein
MKRALPVFVALLISLSGFSQNTNDDLVGKWLSVKDTTVGFRFDAAGYAYFIRGETEIGGDSLDVGGTILQLKYTVDKTKNPYRIDFVRIFKETGKEDTERMLGLFNITNNNTLELMVSDLRPDKMEKDSPDYLMLKRAK